MIDSGELVAVKPRDVACTRNLNVALLFSVSLYVGALVPTRGDLVLRPTFGRLVRALVAPCEAVSGGRAADSASVKTLAGGGPLAAREAVRPPDSVATPLVPWLLGGALALVLLELFVRRGSAPMWTEVSEEAEPQPRPGVVA